ASPPRSAGRGARGAFPPPPRPAQLTKRLPDLWRCANREHLSIRHGLSVLDPMPVRLVRQEAPRQEACGQEGVQSCALRRLLGLGPEHSGESAQRGNPAEDRDRDWPTAGPPVFFSPGSDTRRGEGKSRGGGGGRR